MNAAGGAAGGEDLGVCATTIYLDGLLALNAVLDWLLLRMTAHAASVSVRGWRLGLAALTGGVGGLAVLVPGGTGLPVQAALALAMGLICFGNLGLRRAAELSGLFWGMSCLYAGFLTAFGGMGAAGRSGTMVFVLSGLALSLCAGMFGTGIHTTREVTLCLGDRRCTIRALCDTGHSLREPLGGRECLVADWDSVQTLFASRVREVISTHPGGQQALQALGEQGLAAGFLLIPCRTVQGSTLLLGCGGATVLVDGEPADLVVALTHEKLEQALLPGGYGRRRE